MRATFRFVEERGAGTVVALAIVGAIVGVLVLMVQVTNRDVDQARLNTLADTAAIAGADALRGLVAGFPCKEVSKIASKHSATVAICSISEMDVLVELRSGELTAKARAGEPN
jgi:secretion/DNA translocation related TadE-like protein